MESAVDIDDKKPVSEILQKIGDDWSTDVLQHLPKFRDNLLETAGDLRRLTSDYWVRLSLPLKLEQELKERLKVEKQGQKFRPEEYDLYLNFETNDDEIALRGRDHQIKLMKDIFSVPRSLREKMIVPVLATTKGMGKTFFLKKLAYQNPQDNFDIPSVKDAGKLGRLMTVECSQLSGVFIDWQTYHNYFWPCVIVHHITQIFNDTVVDGIHFKQQSYSDILALLKVRNFVNLPNATPLTRWILNLPNSPNRWITELIRLTNIAFGVKSEAVPVILIDNAHLLAKQTTKIPSKTPGRNHTVLSILLTLWVDYRPYIVVAGTSDGKLQLLADGSNYYAKPIPMNSLDQATARSFVTNLIDLLNNHFQQSINSDLLLNSKLYSIFMYETCCIPRLLKIAVLEWYTGTLNGDCDTEILQNYYLTGRNYYNESESIFLTMDDKILATYILTLNVRFTADTLPGTDIDIPTLQDNGLAFPNTNCHVVPPFFWVEMSEKYPKKWTRILSIIGKMAPGLNVEHLYFSSTKFLQITYNADLLLEVWQNMLVASLMSKYALAKALRETGDIWFKDIYDLKERSQAYPLLSRLAVNVDNGISCPTKEVNLLVRNSVKSLFHNKACPNAQHDVVVTAVPMNLAVQCKDSMKEPTMEMLDLRLDLTQKRTTVLDRDLRLLWIYQGFNDEQSDPPLKYSGRVLDAVTKNQVGFVSGEGCLSPVSFQLFRSLRDNLFKEESIKV